MLAGNALKMQLEMKVKASLLRTRVPRKEGLTIIQPTKKAKGKRVSRTPIMSTRDDMTSLENKELWIGLARVKQLNRAGALGDADQAYVNVIALARSRTDFRSQIKQALTELDLVLIRLEDPEPLAFRRSKHSIHQELRDLAKQVSRTASLRFGTFHSFDEDR
jgi:hypothetical protein